MGFSSFEAGEKSPWDGGLLGRRHRVETTLYYCMLQLYVFYVLSDTMRCQTILPHLWDQPDPSKLRPFSKEKNLLSVLGYLWCLSYLSTNFHLWLSIWLATPEKSNGKYMYPLFSGKNIDQLRVSIYTSSFSFSRYVESSPRSLVSFLINDKWLCRSRLSKTLGYVKSYKVNIIHSCSWWQAGGSTRGSSAVYFKEGFISKNDAWVAKS